MKNNPASKKRIDTILIQEAIWTIKDNIKIILEGVADHEAELIRLRKSINLLKSKIENARQQ